MSKQTSNPNHRRQIHIIDVKSTSSTSNPHHRRQIHIINVTTASQRRGVTTHVRRIQVTSSPIIIIIIITTTTTIPAKQITTLSLVQEPPNPLTPLLSSPSYNLDTPTEQN
ncbi:hypothetical protein Pmani_016618 [Petrolisthes manimaculis]|uniref:Uncharacterized protein n=1 Tax=Petrolisthes manimaculis TaxID=1843537 RepID=A0AAE1PRW5_9EUCA|nr:hypothetical protein Pmani_016618 [Petrolisthes manimaculis]